MPWRGARDAREKILAELEAMAANSYSAAGAMTLVNSLLGNMDETVRWAERAITQRDPQVLGIKTTPAYANLRSDPRYPALLAKMNPDGLRQNHQRAARERELLAELVDHVHLRNVFAGLQAVERDLETERRDAGARGGEFVDAHRAAR